MPKITLSVLGEQLNNLAESHNDLKALIDQLTKGLGPASIKEIDEFGYYDSQNKFHYFNNHLGTQTYDPLSFTIIKGDNQCSSHQMKEGTDGIDFTNDAMACSLVEYVANYVNGVYF